ncbi:MAG: tetratricopeptide repeat protein [Deltaproteobacteria bacterium]|nr:tetratricopeptide repeat protein [Deltaproteobacteria bacterium]
MAQLDVLLSELANFDAQNDLEGLRRIREQIVAEHPQSVEAAEALYKIGLDLLFRERNLSEAMENFEEAAKRKVAFWSDAARTSFGLCLFHQRRPQKALLELRKVAYQENPSSHTVTALSFIEVIHESDGKTDEAKRTRKDRITQLEKLAYQTENTQAAERGYYLYMLGLAYRDQGSDEIAIQTLQEAKAIGQEALGDELYRSITEALQ